MFNAFRRLSIPFALVLLICFGTAVRPAQAEVNQALLALATPLAEQFGVSGSAVSTLLEQGISLESVTQLLLISQNSDKGLDDVTKLYRESKNDVTKTAEELKVAASAYSMDNANAAIDKAKMKLEEDAKKSANETATKAVDSVFDGLAR